MTAATTARAREPCRRWSRCTVAGTVELKEFFRQREAVVFTLLLPVLLLVVFGAVLDYDIGCGVTFVQYFMAGIIAAGILGASLQNMAISIATERSDGTLKALAGTPMPKSAFFVGKVVQVLAVTGLIIASCCHRRVVYDIDLPSGGDWFTFAWVALLGRRGLHAAGDRGLEPGEERPLGLGDGHPLRARPAVHLRRLLPVQLAARVDADHRRGLPAQVDGPGPALGVPARRAGSQEPAGCWELGRVALVLGAWCIAGLLLCVATFRWQDRGLTLSSRQP